MSRDVSATCQDAAIPEDLRRRLEPAVRLITQRARPERIILFGSYATGQATEDSDVDLLVVAEAESRFRLAAELRRLLEPVLAPYAFDLIVCTPQGWERGRHVRGFVTRDADRHGVRLYEAA